MQATKQQNQVMRLKAARDWRRLLPACRTGTEVFFRRIAPSSVRFPRTYLLVMADLSKVLCVISGAYQMKGKWMLRIIPSTARRKRDILNIRLSVVRYICEPWGTYHPFRKTKNGQPVKAPHRPQLGSKCDRKARVPAAA
jgi:hypothetical protein